MIILDRSGERTDLANQPLGAKPELDEVDLEDEVWADRPNARPHSKASATQ